MTRALTIAVLGFVGSGWLLAAPAQSRADTPFGIRVNVGSSSFGYSQGYGYPDSCSYYGSDCGYGRGSYSPGYYGGYANRSWYDGYNGYGSGYNGYGSSFYGNHYHGRGSAIVHPERWHWTPGRGWHTHGHIHVPHRGHSHRIPY
jgi:hypothetical protein